MKTSVSKVITNHELGSPFIEVHVIFKDEINTPHQSATVTVFLEQKDDLVFSEIRNLAIKKARDFLSQV
ncbi:MAG: hypothetical protein ACYSTS_19250 [Planctomycetota bacterium]|jgi:hypothetical protein